MKVKVILKEPVTVGKVDELPGAEVEVNQHTADWLVSEGKARWPAKKKSTKKAVEK